MTCCVLWTSDFNFSLISSILSLFSGAWKLFRARPFNAMSEDCVSCRTHMKLVLGRCPHAWKVK